MANKYLTSKLYLSMEKSSAPWSWAGAKKDKDGEAARKAVMYYLNLPEDELASRISALKDINHICTKLVKRKIWVGGAYVFQSYLANVSKEAAGIQKQLESEKKAEEKQKGDDGLVKATIQILAYDFMGKPINGHSAEIRIGDAGEKPIVKKGKISGGSVGYKDIMIYRNGKIFLDTVNGANKNDRPSGVIQYGPIKGGRLRFSARQLKRVATVNAKSLSEAAKTGKIAGKAGIDFKIIKVGGEKSKSTHEKQVFSKDVKWEIEVPKNVFEMKKL